MACAVEPKAVRFIDVRFTIHEHANAGVHTAYDNSEGTGDQMSTRRLRVMMRMILIGVDFDGVAVPLFKINPPAASEESRRGPWCFRVKETEGSLGNWGRFGGWVPCSFLRKYRFRSAWRA